MWRAMTRDEIEDFWCCPDPPVAEAYFDDASGFASYVLLMRDGSIAACVDSAAHISPQALLAALAEFAR